MITFKVEGLAAIEAQLKELKAQVAGKMMNAAARKAFAPVLESARNRVPVDTGLLRDSLSIAVVKMAGDADNVVTVGLTVKKGKGRSAHWRWHFMEVGTSKSRPRPYARPALDQNAQGMVDTLKEELNKKLARIARKKARGK